MTRKEPYNQLLSQLAEAHNRVLAAAEPLSRESQANFRTHLGQTIATTQSSLSDTNGDEKDGHGWFFSKRLAVIMAVPGLVIAGLALALSRKPAPRIEIRPEPILIRQRPLASSAASVSTKPVDPCVQVRRAAGKRPLIDDFEDANPLVASEEGRVALWSLFQDTEAIGVNATLTPTLRPQPTHSNRYALHARGRELHDWGASLQIGFSPSCYDASAYDGIVFSAKGPGRFYAGVREIRTVPIKYGGTCIDDCFNTHQKKVDLSPQWRTYSITWSEMQQRGYNRPPLDPTRINGISLSIQPGDTPFDFWIDDVKFMAKP